MDDDMFLFDDRVAVNNPGSVFHGQQGVIGEDPKLDEEAYRWVWLDGHPFGMKFRVDELGTIEAAGPVTP